MARMARVIVPGIPHHVTQRGVRSMGIFPGIDDRLDYLQLLKHHSGIHGLHFASYAFMDNHVHLVVIPEREDSLRRAVGEAHRRYTRRINFSTGKRGYFFQGRPFSCPLDDDYYIAALRYVECNPVRAGLVRDPWEYLWSGARYHVGWIATDPLIDVDALSHWHLTAEKWREMLRTEAAQINVLRKKTLTGRPCGGEAFIDRLEASTGRNLHPGKPGPRNRG